jgi:hypothetical protein
MPSSNAFSGFRLPLPWSPQSALLRVLDVLCRGAPGASGYFVSVSLASDGWLALVMG